MPLGEQLTNASIARATVNRAGKWQRIGVAPKLVYMISLAEPLRNTKAGDRDRGVQHCGLGWTAIPDLLFTAARMRLLLANVAIIRNVSRNHQPP